MAESSPGNDAPSMQISLADVDVAVNGNSPGTQLSNTPINEGQFTSKLVTEETASHLLDVTVNTG